MKTTESSSLRPFSGLMPTQSIPSISMSLSQK